MKIYNEVTIDMNPESDTYGKHLSEDSCNYTGDIALCGGGGNDGPPDPHPYYWAENLPGGRPPQVLPGTGALPEGWAGQPIRGIDPFFQTGTKAHFQAETDPSSYQRNEAGELTEEGKKQKSLDEAGARSKMHSEYGDKFMQGWYTPYFESMVAAPMRGMIGMTGAQGAQPLSTPEVHTTVGEYGTPEFIPLSQTNIDPSVLSKFSETMNLSDYPRTQEAGYAEPIIARGFAPDVAEAGQIYSMAEEAYDTAMDRLAEEKDIAADVRSETLKDIRTERLISTREDIPAYEKARAPLATSQMAYSGPAQREVGGYEAKELGQKLSFKEKELAAEEGYAGTISDIEMDEEDVESQLDIDKFEFSTELGDIFAGTAEKAGELLQAGGDILQGHFDYGPSLSTKHETGIMSKPTAWGTMPGISPGGGIWQEQNPYELSLLGGITAESRTAAEKLQAAAQEAITGLTYEPTDV